MAFLKTSINKQIKHGATETAKLRYKMNYSYQRHTKGNKVLEMLSILEKEEGK